MASSFDHARRAIETVEDFGAPGPYRPDPHQRPVAQAYCRHTASIARIWKHCLVKFGFHLRSYMTSLSGRIHSLALRSKLQYNHQVQKKSEIGADQAARYSCARGERRCTGYREAASQPGSIRTSRRYVAGLRSLSGSWRLALRLRIRQREAELRELRQRKMLMENELQRLRRTLSELAE